MKKILIAFSVFAFLFAFSGAGISVKADDNGIKTEKFTPEKKPKADSKKADKSCCSGEAAAKASCDGKAAASCDGKATGAAAKGDCSKSCDGKSTSASVKGDCGSSKATTAEKK